MSKVRWTLALGLAVLVAPAAAVKAQTGSQGALCRALDDGTSRLYDQSAAALRACGFNVYPLTGVSVRPDGGKDYLYTVRGHQHRIAAPPPNFDPTTASMQELVDYGFPPRPTDSAAVPNWQEKVSRLHVPTPPAFLVETHFTGAAIKNFWSGYVDTANSNVFTQSYADYNEPSTSPVCNGDAVFIWTGLGGYYGYPLAQIGTATGGGLGPHEVWDEVLPDEPYAVGQYQYTAPGDDVQARVTWVGGAYNLTISDTTQGWTFNDYYPTSSYNGTSADFIAERPLSGGPNGSPVPLRSFGSLPFNAAQAAQGGGIYGVQTWPHASINMLNSSNVYYLANVSGLGGQSFTDTWDQCS